jgi:pyruvate kinase
MVQKLLIKKTNKAGKPVITATRMLETMISNPRPTRAEVTDIANSIMDGTDAIMLSGETTKGKYPIEAVKTMATIAQKTEENIEYCRNSFIRSGSKRISLTDSVCHAAMTASYDLEAAAIIAPTNSGYTPIQLSKFRPKAPIIAAVHDERIARRLCLCFGVQSIKVPVIRNTDELIDLAIYAAKAQGYVYIGDTVVICAGIPSGDTTFTNMMKVHVVN